MSTTMKSDELNIVNSEQVVEKRNILPIDKFFNEMYLAESEKRERKDLARKIFVILSAILTIVKVNETLGNSHDTDYYKEYVTDNLKSVYEGLFGHKYDTQIDTFASDFIDSTMRHIDTEYFTSDDRATVNAEQQTNAIYNRKQYDDAVKSGKTSKTWVTMHDQRVRKSHVAADGQTVDIDKPFMVGGEELDFPCDPLGSYKNICNCRCTTVYN